MQIRMLDATAVATHALQLRGLLQDAVAHGASVGFVTPLSDTLADAYWREVREAVAAGGRILLVGWRDHVLVGTVQLDLCTKPNGSNRAEVQKLLVHSGARRGGVATALMEAVEVQALALRRGLLYLDTEAGSGAEALYGRMGYTKVGELPEYCATPAGAWRATAIYYKTLFVRERQGSLQG
ncbi:GNAT family N-acetyltransferase [Massilia sp. Dwa41.01b]|uniref:GNAT family N-acetyltransferase n=1 Tax=unclassified Massilia TaxID=2609279 RepID=UPI001603BDBF|nr:MULTISPECIES: GNAT family N-acetyltransferase [unclassified Massilia]QNA88815.1 GNAT family N-acetyltransferase [Massilia sp. Dwa41.01b]QNA99712.1 GNAT family N-acetyltransferase [Massilia sp. Se16.2.3]